MSQEATHRMLHAVERANARLAALGIDNTVAIFYCGFCRAAHLARYLDGRIIATIKDEPEFACWLLAARAESYLKRLLRG